MRQAKKLGALGVLVALVAALGIFARGATTASADRTIANCVDTTNESCTFATALPVVAGGNITFTDLTGGTSIAGFPTVGPFATCAFFPLPGPTFPVSTFTLFCPAGLPQGAIATMLFNNPNSVPVMLQVTYNSPPNPGPPPIPGNCSTTSCVNTGLPAIAPGATFTLQVQAAAGGTVSATTFAGPTGCASGTAFPTVPGSFAIVVVNCTTAVGPGGTFTLGVVSTGGAPTEVTLLAGATAPATEVITFLVGVTPGGSAANKQCNTANGAAPLAGTVVTCTVQTTNAIPVGGSLQITPPAGSTNISCVGTGTAATFAGGVCVFANTGATPIPGGSTVGSETFTVAAAATAGTVLTESASLCSNAVAPCVLVIGTVATTAICSGVGCQVGTAVVPPPVAGLNQPTGEEKWCGPVLGTINNGLPAQITTSPTATTLTNQVAGPSTTFTLAEFSSSPTTCALVPTLGGVPCNTTAVVPPAGAVACSDGYFIISLTSPGSVATISCQNNLNSSLSFSLGTTAGVTIPVISGGGGACQTQTQGTTLQIPCGVTAGTAAASTTKSNTCTGVLFNIQSVLTGCVGEPTVSAGCPLGQNFALTGGTATVTINWLATPANGGVTGGISLGTNTFTFDPPPLGTLLVTATPEAIPSNGTTASVITATFACGNGFNLTSTGFPLSATGYSNFPGLTAIAGTTTTISTVNQPILGTSPGAVCGAGLPGTFNFASPGPLLFDNGRSFESVGCGLGANDNAFGLGAITPNPFTGNNLSNPTFPLVFTCTGAAVLAIGAGAAGDAPINVTYQSSFGGLQAVGSTLVIVSPSGVPRISVACNPATIAAGNTGSVCTATVTDQNGVPLTGITGATVTFTVSDPTEATILPCVVAIPGSINVTTSPNVLPQIVPTTPCNPPSGSLPGQVNTFINGQATALMVASSYARPEVVTVSASLGVLIPPEFACLVSPYTPTGFGTLPAGGFPPIVSGVGLPGLTGCGTSNPVGYTGLASALSTDAGGLTGIVTLPNTTSASTTVQIGGPAGILIAGATTTSPLQLTRGCNQVIVTSTQGTPIANIAALVSPAASVVSIWRFSNSTKQFQAGFFSDPAAPSDFVATGATGTTNLGGANINATAPAAGTQTTEPYFVCVNQAATMISG